VDFAAVKRLLQFFLRYMPDLFGQLFREYAASGLTVHSLALAFERVIDVLDH